MQVGVFVPINNNGWLISETAPQYMPSFDLNKQIAQSAEKHGLDFLLSMIKLRGFGGKTEFWEYGLESFTLMAGLAAVTEKIKIFATCPTLVIPPAFAARMCNTIDSISHGRFGLNLITGWQPPEYTQMGMWPGDEHFRNRYKMLDEYAHILRELWADGVSDFKGDYYQMEDCRVRPKPEGDMKIICAGSSDEGLAFSAKWADYAFCLGKGVNTPTAFASNNSRLAAATAKTGRDVSIFVLIMIIAAETDEEAMAKWQSYNAGADLEAIAWLADQGAKDTHNKDTNVRQLAAPEGAVNINMGTLVGSYESVARMLDEMAEVPNTGGVLLTFDDFVEGVEAFGTRIQPLMRCRAGVKG
ncbi:pyrimidine utilization protein A [Sphingomonas sp. RB3P16]|uniref:pyrimidine utilization protein A n=1 Tax=Parasphingomonas frigoris TaxID=3096163 RepID=UPI002FC68B97